MSESSFKRNQDANIRKYTSTLLRKLGSKDLDTRRKIQITLKESAHRRTDPKKVKNQVQLVARQMLLNNELLKSETFKR